ncbi:hypothetical protein RV11_GL002243 [Enterococcus phoeniculicola]|jgi:hypothetical protein|nr:hypothetical protein RV11_GL002243 [Enterococcus phoeniculicola]
MEMLTIMNEEELKQLLIENAQLKKILTIIEALQLRDCWLCAGTIRNFIWNYLSGMNELDTTNDVDVVFFDPTVSYEETLQIEKWLKKTYPNWNWELKNEVYMHIHNPETLPYKDSYDAIEKFPETCTSIAARLNGNQLELMAPHGIEDMVHFIVQPTPHFKESVVRGKIYQKRVRQKNWKKTWEKIQIIEIDNL